MTCVWVGKYFRCVLHLFGEPYILLALIFRAKISYYFLKLKNHKYLYAAYK